MVDQRTSDYLPINEALDADLLDIARPGISNFKMTIANLKTQLQNQLSFGGSASFLDNPRCIKEGIYYYFGGEQSSGDWKINRYLVSDVNTSVSATEGTNPTYTTLDDAWINRATLTYA